MILNGNAVHKSHYDILGVEEDANYEDIRAVYRSAILSFHPDKRHSTPDSSPSKRETENRFLEIQKAWEILSDQRSRTIYDNELRSLRQDAATSEDIGVDDLKVEAAGDVLELSYPCRCGDFYVIDSLDLADIGCPLVRDGRKMFIETSKDLPASVVLPCGSCSLKVRLLISPNTRLELDDTDF
nr:DPH4 homolog [Ipomoea trifida]GMD96308.1 DPH4 homolog [Ipomoea batatas]